MSKLRRQIRNLGRSTSGGIGFQHPRATEHAAQVLVAATVASGDEARVAVEAGAHILLAGPGAVADAVAAAGDRPVGVRFEAATAEAIASATDAGADFIIFDDGRTPATALLGSRNDQREPPGRVLILGEERGEERLRAAAGLGADAVLLEDVALDLTVRDQLALRRISELTGAPLLLVASDAPSADVLRTWRDAGAPIVLVSGEDAVRATVAAAHDVPPPRRPRDERTALIPSLAPHAHDDDDDD